MVAVGGYEGRQRARARIGLTVQNVPSRNWRDGLAIALAVTDLLIIGASVGAAFLVFFLGPPSPRPAHLALSAVFAGAWWLSLLASRDVAARAVGMVVTELRRVGFRTAMAFGMLAIGCEIVDVHFGKPLVTVALPMGMVGLLLSRWLWFVGVRMARRDGVMKTRVLVVGDKESALQLADAITTEISREYELVGISAPNTWNARTSHLRHGGTTVPLFDAGVSIEEAAQRLRADIVMLTSAANLDAASLRELTWSLEPLDARVALAPDISDIAAFRMQTREVGHRPIVVADRPRHDRARSYAKAIFDRVFALAALIFFSPVLIGLALAIKLTSRGPIFYRSERYGLDGEKFQMVKFRSMVVDADRQIDTLIAESGGGGLVWKHKNDPRVTSVGRVIRRYSLDELPQFFNVLAGAMSVVGPRPQVRREVELYDDAMRRRLLVKPGCTGLWQISGRNDLPVDEAMRLDQYYVDNWSMGHDLAIITRTLKAVLRGSGAY